jgi:hypothetical protein
VNNKYIPAKIHNQEIIFPKLPYTKFEPAGVDAIFINGFIFDQGFRAIVPSARGPLQGD